MIRYEPMRILQASRPDSFVQPDGRGFSANCFIDATIRARSFLSILGSCFCAFLRISKEYFKCRNPLRFHELLARTEYSLAILLWHCRMRVYLRVLQCHSSVYSTRRLAKLLL